MKKCQIFILCFGLMMLTTGCMVSRWIGSGQFVDERGFAIHDAVDIVIEKPETRLPEYETMTFNLKWIGIPVGTVTMSVKGISQISGRDAYCLEAVFKANKFLSAIYKIEDRFVSYMDVEKLYTLRQEVYRREGSYQKDAVTVFDQINHKAYFTNSIDQSKKTIDIPADVQDTLSVCYFFMMLPLKVGDKIDCSVYNSEQIYQLMGVVEEKVFIRNAALGLKKSFKMQPYVRQNGKQVQKGNLSAYFSCDKRRVPLVGKLKGVIFTEAMFTLSKITTKEK